MLSNAWRLDLTNPFTRWLTKQSTSLSASIINNSSVIFNIIRLISTLQYILQYLSVLFAISETMVVKTRQGQSIADVEVSHALLVCEPPLIIVGGGAASRRRHRIQYISQKTQKRFRWKRRAMRGHPKKDWCWIYWYTKRSSQATQKAYRVKREVEVHDLCEWSSREWFFRAEWIFKCYVSAESRPVAW